jgi:hypothetical protein
MKLLLLLLSFFPIILFSDPPKPSLEERIFDPKVERMEDLLPSLPESIRSNYTYVHTSKSEQDANPKFPRTIMVGEDTDDPDHLYILTFNGHPSQRGYDTLEIIIADVRTGELRTRKRIFAGDTKEMKEYRKENNITKVPEPAQACAKCHRENTRLNWQGYDKWPGLYGEHDDVIDPQKDKNGFIAFRDNQALKGRYRFLIPPKDSPVAPYNTQFKGGSLSHRPNLRLTVIFSSLQAKRLANQIKQAPRYKELRELLRFALIGCNVTQGSLQKVPGLELGKEKREPNEKVKPEEFLLITLGALGIKPVDWNMDCVKSEDLPKYKKMPINFAGDLLGVVREGHYLVINELFTENKIALTPHSTQIQGESRNYISETSRLPQVYGDEYRKHYTGSPVIKKAIGDMSSGTCPNVDEYINSTFSAKPHEPKKQETHQEG